MRLIKSLYIGFGLSLLLRSLKREYSTFLIQNPIDLTFQKREYQYVKSFGLLGLLLKKEFSSPTHNTTLFHFCRTAPLFDDFFDKNNLSSAEIDNLLTNHEAKAKSTNEHLFLESFKQLLSAVPNPTLFLKFAKELAKAQFDSLKQKNESQLSIKDIQTFTENKGGYSCLLLASLFLKEIDQSLENDLYQLGATFQLMDDIFDWYDDVQENTLTLPNQLSLLELQQEYTKKTLSISQKSDNLSESFIDSIELLLALGKVCLSHFSSLDIDTLSPPINARSYYICDMEKPKNILQLLLA